ncbi:MAG: HlyD family type I secretion periplasmic adaptor subunit [Hyphomicrobiaceae bacterium]
MTTREHGPRAATNTPADTFGIRRRIVFGGLVMSLLVAGLGGWSAVAELSGAVISHGSVVVSHYVKKVQHKDGGIVAAIMARNGDTVREGAPLVRLDDTQIKAELGVVEAQLVELRGRLARLTAEQRLADSITFPPGYAALAGAANIMLGETVLFQENRKSRTTQKEQLAERVLQLSQEAQGLAAQEEAKRLELKLIRLELERVRTLSDKQLMPQMRVYALERDEARLKGEHGSLVSQGARVKGQVNEIKLQILAVDQTTRTEAQRELRNAESRIAELAEREVAIRDKLARTQIAAPITGIVHQLNVHTIGGIITPAEPLMLIVPEGDALAIELKIQPIDIDQVHIGQAVRLRFTAFNQRTTPEVRGNVTYISPDITPDPKGRDFYTVRASLAPGQPWKIGPRDIQPGMPVEAYLTTSRRTALSYLTKPVTDQFARAFQER